MKQRRVSVLTIMKMQLEITLFRNVYKAPKGIEKGKPLKKTSLTVNNNFFD